MRTRTPIRNMTLTNTRQRSFSDLVASKASRSSRTRRSRVGWERGVGLPAREKLSRLRRASASSRPWSGCIARRSQRRAILQQVAQGRPARSAAFKSPPARAASLKAVDRPRAPRVSSKGDSGTHSWWAVAHYRLACKVLLLGRLRTMSPLGRTTSPCLSWQNTSSASSV